MDFKFCTKYSALNQNVTRVWSIEYELILFSSKFSAAKIKGRKFYNKKNYCIFFVASFSVRRSAWIQYSQYSPVLCVLRSVSDCSYELNETIE